MSGAPTPISVSAPSPGGSIALANSNSETGSGPLASARFQTAATEAVTRNRSDFAGTVVKLADNPPPAGNPALADIAPAAGSAAQPGEIPHAVEITTVALLISSPLQWDFGKPPRSP